MALNQIRLDCMASTQPVGVLTVCYPPNRVFAPRPTASGGSALVEYELCYTMGGDDIPTDVLERAAPEGALTPFRDARERVDGGTIEYSKYNDVVYRFDTPDGLKGGPARLARLLINTSAPIHEGMFARAEIEQLINGSWRKLTRYRWGGGMGFWPAPQDSIRLRCRFVAQHVYYYPDRVIVDDAIVDGGSGLEIEVAKPIDGYWPPFDGLQPFFKEFKESRLKPGGVLEIGYPIKPASHLYTLDVHVLSGDRRCSPRLVVAIVGPNMTFPNDDPSQLSDWPLAIGGVGSDDTVTDLGYPGGPLAPVWVADRLFELGDGFWGANEQNEAAYTKHFRERAGMN